MTISGAGGGQLLDWRSRRRRALVLQYRTESIRGLALVYNAIFFTYALVLNRYY